MALGFLALTPSTEHLRGGWGFRVPEVLESGRPRVPRYVKDVKPQRRVADAFLGELVDQVIVRGEEVVVAGSDPGTSLWEYRDCLDLEGYEIFLYKG